jgi:hypothetical protein
MPRDTLFKVGARYRVLSDFQTLNDAFVAGEIVAFREAVYGRYDCCYAYRFSSQLDPKGKSWYLRDGDIDHSRELFLEVDAESGDGALLTSTP